MPTRFRKTVTIFPGVKANISKGGVSFSLGRKGFTINVGKHGVRRTVSLPGTGVSNTEYISKTDSDEDENEDREEKDGLLGGAGAALLGMAAVNAVDDDDEDDRKPKRKTRRKTRKTQGKNTSKESREPAPSHGYALRGIMIFAALAIAAYAGSQVIQRLPPTWLQDLTHFIVQWAVQFGH